MKEKLKTKRKCKNEYTALLASNKALQKLTNHGQVILLTQDIEESFSAKKAGAVFVDLTAAYDTVVLHRCLTCKLLRLLPDR